MQLFTLNNFPILLNIIALVIAEALNVTALVSAEGLAVGAVAVLPLLPLLWLAHKLRCQKVQSILQSRQMEVSLHGLG